MISGKKILLTGGAGFIGSNIAHALIYQNQITVVDNLVNGNQKNLSGLSGNNNFKFEEKDLLGENSLESIEGIDLVMDFAAHAGIRDIGSDPKKYFMENISITANVLEFMRKKDIRDMIFASTSSVYGETEKQPIPEDWPSIPISSYGSSKVAAEALIHSYSHYYGINARIMRFANVLGKNSNKGASYEFVRDLKKDPTMLTTFGSRYQTKSYIHVSDCISAMSNLFENSKKTDVFNIGTEDVLSLESLVSIIIEEMGLKDVKVTFGGDKLGRGWKGDVKSFILDISKIKALGWKYKYNSEEAMRLAVRELLEQNRFGV